MITVLQGDALTKLRELPDESVQCCVTSPPYWGLRDYGTAEWDGGNDGCDHKYSVTSPYNEVCGKCGAKRIDSQLGLEKTPEEYVAKMVEIFREVRRVLRKDGTLWLNLGDTYNSRLDGSHGGWNGDAYDKGKNPQKVDWRGPTNSWSGTIKRLAPKNLVGIPWKIAFALQDDGWILRQDIIWAKPNPMPESVTDRCTKSHEYMFLLSKSSRYFYDAEAIKEVAEYGRSEWSGNKTTETYALGTSDRNPARGSNTVIPGDGGTRNKRSVWTVATAPYPDAHFATYPPDLIKPCVTAGTKHGDVVLDPFGGSGTTGMVAIELGRKAILIELNPKYAALIEQRCTTTIGLPL